MEGLSFDNILGEQDIANLFTEPEETLAQEEQKGAGEEPETNDEKDKTTEVVEPELLFTEEPPAEEEKKEEQPESVGSEEKKEEEKEDAVHDEDDGTSPNENFYSSIANACAVDGIFPNLDEERIKQVDDAESFSNLIEEEVNARLDEKQQRIAKALESGVEPTDIRKYEGALNYLSSIQDSQLAEESEKGEELRRNIIFQDFINKGYSQEKAQKLTARSIETGNDVEDAKEALQSNKEYFQKEYDDLLKKAQKEAEEEKKMRTKLTEKVKDSIMKDNNLLGDVELSDSIRKKTYENIFKPIYKNAETGEYLTALQKYQEENESDFLKYTGLIFTLTNGFKDFDSFTKGKVKKEVKKGIRELEQTLNNTKRSTDGSLKMITGVQEDPESFFKGIKLDL